MEIRAETDTYYYFTLYMCITSISDNKYRTKKKMRIIIVAINACYERGTFDAIFNPLGNCEDFMPEKKTVFHIKNSNCKIKQFSTALYFCYRIESNEQKEFRQIERANLLSP